jgi:glycosyltransferase involved in cell wall biosynthesis
MKNSSTPQLTVVLPCLNEAETLQVCIQNCLSSFLHLGIEGEVIVADNGSDDGSQNIAINEGAVVVNVPTRGYGAALSGGIANARAPFVIMGDSDDSYALEDLTLLYYALLNGADLVMGNRFKGGIQRGAMPWLHKYVGNPVLSWLGRKLFKIKIGDFHCGLRGFRKDSIESLNLKTTGMEFASEMVVKAALANLTIAEVPVILRPDGRTRSPHLRTWRDGWRHLKFLLLMSPNWLYGAPAFVFVFVGTLSLAVLSRGPVDIQGIQFGIQSVVLSAMLVSIGIQFFIGGVVANKFGQNVMPDEFYRIKRNAFSYFANKHIEYFLVFGLILFAIGLAILFLSLSNWANLNFGGLVPHMSAMYASVIGIFLTSGMAVLSLGLAVGALEIE